MPSPAGDDRARKQDIAGLKDVLKGQLSIGTDDRFLSALVPTGGQTVELKNPFHTTFIDLMRDAVDYKQLIIVGNRYRNSEQQAALNHKSKGTLVLLVREPGNPHDPNAVACLVTQGIADAPVGRDNVFTWRHVGYLPKHVAANLAPCWPESNGYPMVIQAILRDSAQARRNSGNVYLDVINDQYSLNIRARDIGRMF